MISFGDSKHESGELFLNACMTVPTFKSLYSGMENRFLDE